MAIVIGTFVTALGVILGIYWLLAWRVETREDKTMQERLVKGAALVAPAIVNAEGALSAIGPMDRLLSRFRHVLAPLRRLIERSALHVTTGAVLLASVLVAMLAFVVVGWVVHFLPVQLAAAAIALVTPVTFVRHSFQRRMRKFEEQFPDAIDLMARSLRAGHALTTAMELVASEVPDPIGGEFRLLFERQNYGMSLEDALRQFANRVPLVDARFFVTAVLTQREVGGNLSEVLERLAAVIRERFKVKREIRVASAHGRITGWVLGFMPPALAVVLFTISPEHIKLLLRDPVGVQMVVAAVGLQLLGVLFIKRIVNVEY